MKTQRKIATAALAVALLCALGAGAASAKGGQAGEEKEVTIFFTHDMHSHLDEYQVGKPELSQDSKEEKEWIGGFARLKTLLDEKRAENEPSVLLDGGDFSMGTLYQTIYETEAAELTMMGKLGYDATTFGNHEFDYRSEGVANMLHSALENAAADPDTKLPAFVTANIDWEKNTSEENLLVKKALEDYGSTPWTIIERDGLRVGVYGVMGEDADACAPESGIAFDGIVETSKEVVEKLKEEGADLIVCLSHSGTSEDVKKSEDERLAKEVPDIDVIVSGHTHTALEEYIQVGDTYIVSAGSFGKYLGELKIQSSKEGRWEAEGYQLIRLDEDIAPDESVTQELDHYKKMVDEQYLSQFGYTFDKVLAKNTVAFTQSDQFAEKLGEDPLGSIIADSYIYAVERAEGEQYEKVDVAVTPSGVVRDTLQTGPIRVSDAFNICSLGIGADRIPGYPLVGVYLTGDELKTMAEIDVSVSPLMTAAQLYPSGVHWTYNPNRMILNRVTEVKQVTDVPYSEVKEEEKLQDDQLYRVVADLYSAQMLGAVKDTSKGLLKVIPKDKDGKEIKDFEAAIICDQNGTELKEWYALATYLESFEKDADGISQVPVRYGEAEGRKKEVDSKNIGELLKSPNQFALILYGVLLAILVIVAVLVRFIIKRRKKKKNMLY